MSDDTLKTLVVGPIANHMLCVAGSCAECAGKGGACCGFGPGCLAPTRHDSPPASSEDLQVHLRAPRTGP